MSARVASGLLVGLLSGVGCGLGESSAPVLPDPVSLDTAALPATAAPEAWADRQVDHLEDAPTRAAFRASAQAAVQGYERSLRDRMASVSEATASAVEQRALEASLSDLRTRLRRVGHDLDTLPEEGWRAAGRPVVEDLRAVQSGLRTLSQEPPPLLKR